MFATIWNGPAKPKDGKRKESTAWIMQHTYPKSNGVDDELEQEELPDELSELSDEPETPLRHHIAMRGMLTARKGLRRRWRNTTPVIRA